MDNFAFLKTEWPDLAELGHVAETNLGRDPNTVLMKLRLFGELTAVYIMKKEGLPEPAAWEDRRFWVRLLIIKNYQVVPGFVLDHLHALRMGGNKATHENYGDPRHAAAMLLKAFALGVWLMQTYGQPDVIPKQFIWENAQDEVTKEEKPKILLLNLFKPYGEVSDEELRIQVAILQNTKIMNYLKETAGKVFRLLTKKLNQAGQLFNQEEMLPAVELKTVSDLVEEAATNLQSCTRRELFTLFRAELAKRVKVRGKLSPEALSIAMIKEAAAGVRLDRGLSLAQRAQLIYDRYKERLWKEAQKWAKHFTLEEKKKVATSLDESLGRLKEEDRRVLEKSLGVERLSGNLILRAITGAAGPLSVIALVELTGFGSYLMLTTVLHAVFTTMLGITLPFAFYTGATSLLGLLAGPVGWFLAAGFGGLQVQKEKREINRNLLSMIIWYSISHHQGQVVPWDEDLPSWAENEEREMIEAKDERISKLIAEKATLTAHLAAAADRAKKAKANQTKLSARRLHTIAQRDALIGEKLNWEKAFVDGTWKEQRITPTYHGKAKNLLRKISEHISAASFLENYLPGQEEEYRRAIAHKAGEIEKRQQKLQQLEKELTAADRQFKQTSAELSNLKEAVDLADQHLESYLTSRLQEINNLWELHFRRLDFSEQALRWVASLPLAQRLVIERYLLELNELSQPALLADGETDFGGKNAAYFIIHLAKGKRIRLVYSTKPGGRTEINSFEGESEKPVRW